MAYDGGIFRYTPPRRFGGITRVNTRFSLSVENEQADAGRDGRTRLAKPNSQARTGITGNMIFPCSADHGENSQPYLDDPYSCYM